jgi:PAS domain-containing protein
MNGLKSFLENKMHVLPWGGKSRQLPSWMAQATLESAIDAVVVVNSENNVIFYNQAAEGLWGYMPQEVLGQNVKMLVPKVHQSRHDGYLAANRGKTTARKLLASFAERGIKSAVSQAAGSTSRGHLTRACDVAKIVTFTPT